MKNIYLFFVVFFLLFDLAVSQSVRIMPLGDSITKGTGTCIDGSYLDCIGYRRTLDHLLANAGYSFDFVGSQGGEFQAGKDYDNDHEGHGGATAYNINELIDTSMITYDPQIVLYHIGTNSLDAADIDIYIGWVNTTLDKIYEHNPDAYVILAQIILTADDTTRNQRTREYNDRLITDVVSVQQAQGHAIDTVDMEHALNYSTDMYNNLHPNAQGYDKMANVWFNKLDMILSDYSLPVSLVSFDAFYLSDEVELQWTTGSEIDNAGFEILRAADKQGNYDRIDSYLYNPDLEGQGNSSSGTAYTYIDKFVEPDKKYWYKLVDVDLHGKKTTHGPVQVKMKPVSDTYRLFQNYPNPFNATTTISFYLPSPEHVTLTLFDALGKKDKVILDEKLDGGVHHTILTTAGLSTGSYFYRFEAGKFSVTKKMLYIK